MSRLAIAINIVLVTIGCAREERVNLRSASAVTSKSAADQVVQTDTGQIGPVPTGLVGGVWATGSCSEIYVPGQVETTDSMIKVNGLGDLAVAVDYSAELDLQIDFSLCEPNYYSRAIVFVVDTSESMRSSENIGTDPIREGTCGRLEAIRNFLAALPQNNQVKVGFVTFSTNVDKDSSTLFTARKFADEFLNTSSLCHRRMGTSGVDTNYTAGLTRAEDLLASFSGHMASQEVYLITDGLPGSPAIDGRAAAERLRSRGLVGTLLLGSNDGFLKTSIASRRPDGTPVHALASHAGALSAALADTISTRIDGGTFSYLTDDLDEWVNFPLDPELTFFHANGVMRADYTGALTIEIKDVDENGVTRNRRAKLEIIRRDR